MKPIITWLKAKALYLAFTQAWIATLGSLYFSEIRGLTPCLLCWYQRILMYPLVIIFTVAIVRKDKNVPYYVLPFSILGMLVALYQYLLQMTELSQIVPSTCNALVSCSAIQLVYFGFITIPFLSFIAFTTISFLMIIMIKSSHNNEHRK